MIRAAGRDASWFNRPDTHSAKAIHVDNGQEFAACNSGLPLGALAWEDAAEVPEAARCSRRACAIGYEKASTDSETP